MSFTPGPWEVQPLALDTYCGDMTYEVITETYDVVSYQCAIRKYGDAALIAAAPDLLEALEWAMGTLAGMGIEYPRGYAAIAKAKGK